MKLIFIVNQKSGNGKGAKIWRAIQKDLSVPYDVYITQYEKQAIAFSRAIAEQSNNDKQRHGSQTVRFRAVAQQQSASNAQSSRKIWEVDYKKQCR